MKMLLVACSLRGYELLERIREGWRRENPGDELITLVKCKALPELSEEKSLTLCVGEWFEGADAIVFLCAAGIAVRCIAPYLVHKAKDPAVVVLDELGAYCIPILSGHAGGANELAERLGRLTGAAPVITTASDREGKPAVDMFAKKNGLFFSDWQAARDLEARLLAGERIGLLASEDLRLSASMPLPEEFAAGEEAGTCAGGMYVTVRDLDDRREEIPFSLTLRLYPRAVALGIGCRRGVTREQIERAAEACLKSVKVSKKAIYTAATIDLKKDEPGLLAFCREFGAESGMENGGGLPLAVFSAEELKKQRGSFTESAFVCKVTGVDNVCERSAVAAVCAGGQTAKLLCRKFILDGVTVALACREEIALSD